MNAPVKTIRVGSLSIAIRRYAGGRYGFDFQPPGEDRKKVRRVTLEDAIERAREILGAARGGKVERLAIDEGEYAEFLQWKAKRKAPAMIAAIVPGFLAAKLAKGVCIHTLRELKSTLLPFATEFGDVNLADLRRAQLEKWLSERPIGPRRWNNMIAAVVSLYRYARRDGLLPAEQTPIEHIERKKLTMNVATYTPAELRALIDAVTDISPEWTPAIALGAFAGLRPEEIAADPRNGGYKPGLRWENIVMERRKIDVPAEVSKVRRRRIVPMNDTLIAWLTPYAQSRGFVAPLRARQKLTPQWLDRAGIEWKNDALRHSYATYRLAQTRDIASLALEMGNSPAMLHRHYVTVSPQIEDDAREWFAILPHEQTNIIQIRTA